MLIKTSRSESFKIKITRKKFQQRWAEEFNSGGKGLIKYSESYSFLSLVAHDLSYIIVLQILLLFFKKLNVFIWFLMWVFHF
jgi:hypothetical protein